MKPSFPKACSALIGVLAQSVVIFPPLKISRKQKCSSRCCSRAVNDNYMQMYYGCTKISYGNETGMLMAQMDNLLFLLGHKGNIKKLNNFLQHFKFTFSVIVLLFKIQTYKKSISDKLCA